MHRVDVDARSAGGFEKLRMLEKVRAAGEFANERPADLMEAEKMLREFAAMEKGSVS